MAANLAHHSAYLLVSLTITLGPFVAGCFGPRIESGAFACEPADDPPYPSGFFCADGRCVTSAAARDASVPRDLGDGDDAGPARDLSAKSGDLARGGDLAQGAQDLAAPRDLAAPPDLATGMCGHAGTPCTTIEECCSMYCRSDGICIGG